MYPRLPDGPTSTPAEIAADGRDLWKENLPALAWLTLLFTSPFVVATVALTIGLGEIVEVDGRIDVLFETATARDVHRMLTGTLAIANVVAGLVAWGAAAAYLWNRLGPKPIDWRHALELTMQKLGPLLRVAMVEFLIVVMMAIVLIAVFNVGIPALVVAVLGAFAIFIRVWPLQLIVMLEEEGTLDSFRRAWDLVAGWGWHVSRTLMFTLLRLIGYGLALALLTLMLTPIIEGLLGSSATLVWAAVTQLAFLALLSPLLAAVAVPLYVDLRRRHETE